MTDPGLNARLSVAMGYAWDEMRCRVCGWTLASSVDDGCVPDNCALRPPPDVRADTPPDFSNPGIFSRVEQAIHDRGLGPKYAGVITELLWPQNDFVSDFEWVGNLDEAWELMRAPLDLKARAALSVLEGKT